MKTKLGRVAMSVGMMSSMLGACLSSASPPGATMDAGTDGAGSSSGTSSGTSSSGSGSSGSSGSSSGGSSGGGSTGSSGSSGSGSSGGSSGSGGAADSGANCTMVPLTPSSTGYIDTTSIGIVGAWFAYGDDIGNGGSPPGPCVSKGMHAASACSVVTSPPPPADGGTASFPQKTPGSMCLSGTAAQVVGTPPDYSNIFGIGIGLNLNNPSGTPATYNATTNHVTGFQFTVAGLPTGTVRVEVSEPATDATGDAWSYTLASSGLVTVHLEAGTGAGQLSPAFTPAMGTTQPAFDPTMLEAIEFHVVTNATSPTTVSNFCISDLQAIVCP